MADQNLYRIHLEIPFSTPRHAQIAYDVLRVDKEPKRSHVTKTLQTNEKILLVDFTGYSVKGLRVTVNGFLDKVDLVANTMESFGPPVSEEYSHY